MKLARYWSRESAETTREDGSRVRVAARGWSNQSIEEARRLGRDLANRLARALASNDFEGKRYLYGERPLPEPILREFGNGGANPAAIVTRNSYGALVLNTRDLMFVDIDRDDETAGGASGLLSSIKSLFREPELIPAQPPSKVVGEIQRVAEGSRLSARVYKTAAGYRAIITNANYQPGAAQSEALLKQFGSDPLYIRLCKMQESFRARLSPKPWRCGQPEPPVSFPFTSPQQEAQFQEWERKYSSAAGRYSTCRFVTTIGGGRTDPAFEELIHYHDQETRANSSLPLA
jgi:hypothetical protein